jgi:hypothetical protein
MSLVSIYRLATLITAVLVSLAITWAVTKAYFQTAHRHGGWAFVWAPLAVLATVLFPMALVAVLIAWAFDSVSPFFAFGTMLLWACPTLAISLRNAAKYRKAGQTEGGYR